MKFLNISNIQIKALTISIIPMDITEKICGEDIKYQYLDLSASRNDYFGDRKPIKLENNAIRSFYVRVDEVIFTNNTTWTSAGGEWTPLRIQGSIESSLGNPELIKQYKLEYGESCKYVPVRDRDLWLCSCGAVNRVSEEKCCKCQNDVSIFSIDTEVLKEKSSARAVYEREANAKRKKIAVIAALAAVLIIAVFVVVNNIILPYHANLKEYNAAMDMLAVGNYDEAYAKLEALGEFKDSEMQIAESKYSRAKEYISVEDFQSAFYLIGEIHGYKDADTLKENSIKTMYDKFVGLVDGGNYVEAYNYYDSVASLFEKYPDYEKLKEYLCYNSLKIFLSGTVEMSYDEVIDYKNFLEYITEFEDGAQIADKINTLIDTIRNLQETYAKPNSNGLECGLELGGSLLSSVYYFYRTSTIHKAVEVNLNVTYVMQNGNLLYINAAGTQGRNYKITPTQNGINAELTKDPDIFDQAYDFVGTYTKQ